MDKKTARWFALGIGSFLLLIVLIMPLILSGAMMGERPLPKPEPSPSAAR